MAHGTGLFVVNKDAKTVQADTADIYAIAVGAAAFEAAVVPVPNPGLPNLDLFISASLSGAPAAPHFTQALKVKCYGYIKAEPAALSLYPSDVDSSFDAPGTTTIGSGFWIPLYNPTTGTHEQTFPTTVEIVKAAATRLLFGGRQFVAPDGVEQIMVVVSQGLTGTNLNKAVVVGRFTSPGGST